LTEIGEPVTDAVQSDVIVHNGIPGRLGN